MKEVNKSQEGWVWMPHPAHFCAASHCRFRLATYVPTGYIISTIGEYFPDEVVRRIVLESKVQFPNPFEEDKTEVYKKILKLNGDLFNDAYLKYIGYEELRYDCLYETMVFPAKKNENPKFQCCPYLMDQEKEEYELEQEDYNDPGEATNGHYELCYKWSQKEKI